MFTNEKVRKVAQGLTENLIELLKNNPKSWTKSWVAVHGFEVPHNPITKTIYKGSNVLVLSMAKSCEGWEDGRFATYKQWQSKGCQVQKGERGTEIIYWAPKMVCNEETPCKGLFNIGKTCKENHKMKKVLLERTYTVFNASQVEALEGEKPEHPSLPVRVEETELTNDEQVEKIRSEFLKVGANWKEENGGDRACFIPSQDKIITPIADQFISLSEWVSTVGHEFGHWSGYESRLNRDLEGRFGDAKYAFEELIAELCGVFLANVLGVEHQPLDNHASYLKSWIRALEGEDGAQLLWKAGTDAQKAASYILDKMEGVGASEGYEDAQESSYEAVALKEVA